jgi:hypothetical protein
VSSLKKIRRFEFGLVIFPDKRRVQRLGFANKSYQHSNRTTPNAIAGENFVPCAKGNRIYGHAEWRVFFYFLPNPL